MEYCDKEKVVLREQYYLDLLQPEYNILKTAGSCLGRKASLETRAAMRRAALGRKLSEETKAKQKNGSTWKKALRRDSV